MQRELADLIRREVKDPRVGFVTVAGVEVSKDFAHAKVFVTILGTPEEVEKTLDALAHAAGFLRRELGQRMRLRLTPELHFAHDLSVERGHRLSALIDRAVAEDQQKSNESDPNE